MGPAAERVAQDKRTRSRRNPNHSLPRGALRRLVPSPGVDVPPKASTPAAARRGGGGATVRRGEKWGTHSFCEGEMGRPYGFPRGFFCFL